MLAAGLQKELDPFRDEVIVTLYTHVVQFPNKEKTRSELLAELMVLAKPLLKLCLSLGGEGGKMEKGSWETLRARRGPACHRP